MVSATSLPAGVVRNVTVVRYVPGPAGVAVRAVGPSAVTAGPAANPLPAQAPPPAASRPAPARNLAAIHVTSHLIEVKVLDSG